MTTTTIYDTLREDGDTVELPDGRTLRLRITPDETTRLDDFDIYGDAYAVKSERTVELLSISGPFDWEPPADYEDMTEDAKATLRVLVGEIVSFGFVAVWLEVLDGTKDAYGKPVVKDYAVIGGVEPLAGDYDIAYVLTDYLLPDLGLD